VKASQLWVLSPVAAVEVGHHGQVTRPVDETRQISATQSENMISEEATRHVQIADSAPLSAVEWAAVTKRRSAGSGLLPRDQVRAWMPAAKAVGCVPVGVLGWTGLVVSSRYRRNARGLLACSV
jgi:hypothetical protein